MDFGKMKNMEVHSVVLNLIQTQARQRNSNILILANSMGFTSLTIPVKPVLKIKPYVNVHITIKSDFIHLFSSADLGFNKQSSMNMCK